MKASDAHPGRVFEWRSSLSWANELYETVYVTLDCWRRHDDDEVPTLRVLVLHTTYPYYTPGKVMMLHTGDRMWMQATRIA